MSWTRRDNLSCYKLYCSIRSCLLLLHLFDWSTRVLSWRYCWLFSICCLISSNYLNLFMTSTLIIFQIIYRSIILLDIYMILLLRFIWSGWCSFSKDYWIIIILQRGLYLRRRLLWRSIHWLMKLLACVPLTIIWTITSIFSINWLFQITVCWLCWRLLKPVRSFIWLDFIDCLFIMVIIRRVKCTLIIYLLTLWILF